VTHREASLIAQIQDNDDEGAGTPEVSLSPSWIMP
jgi:hypothetical protein